MTRRQVTRFEVPQRDGSVWVMRRRVQADKSIWTEVVEVRPPKIASEPEKP